MARMLTTNGPENGPAGTVWILVRNIGTVESLSMCQSAIPALINACSNVNEHPSAKVTRRLFQIVSMSLASDASFPSR